MTLILSLPGAGLALAACESDPCKWALRGFGLWLEPTADGLVLTSRRPNGVRETKSLEVLGGPGFGISGERRFGRLLGLEAGALFANLDLEFTLDLDGQSGQDSASVGFTSLYIGPDFHLTPNSSIDFYVGVFLGYVDMGDGFGDLYHDEDDAMFQVLGEWHNANISDAYFVGVQLGLDIPFGGRAWALHLGARYLPITSEVDSADLEIDPIGVEIGVAYRL